MNILTASEQLSLKETSVHYQYDVLDESSKFTREMSNAETHVERAESLCNWPPGISALMEDRHQNCVPLLNHITLDVNGVDVFLCYTNLFNVGRRDHCSCKKSISEIVIN